MYKALDTRSGTPIVILAESQCRIEEELRDWGRGGRLVCPGCRTEVETRNGDVNRPHFAHWHRQNCPLNEIPPEVELAKALLYEWLQPKYGADLTYEYRAPHAGELPRPIDLRAKTGSGGLVFWVIGKGMNPPARTLLQDTLCASVDHVRYVFTEKMLQEQSAGEARAEDGESTRLKLTKTERVFLRRTPYDLLHERSLSGKGKTMSYLLVGSRPGEEGKPPQMRTYRNLRRVHDPAIYRGVARETPLEELKVMPSTGLVVHPGEHEALPRRRKEREEQRRQKEEEYTRAAQRRKDERERFEREYESARGTKEDGSSYLRRLSTSHGPGADSSSGPDLHGLLSHAITCKKCGRKTKNWSVSNGDGTGICREC